MRYRKAHGEVNIEQRIVNHKVRRFCVSAKFDDSAKARLSFGKANGGS